MISETVTHPDLTALVATNRSQDIRHIIHDWLLDRDELDLAARVLACETDEQVETAISRERMAIAFREIAARMNEATADAMRGLTAVGKAMADAMRPAAESQTAAFNRPEFVEAVRKMNGVRKGKK